MLEKNIKQWKHYQRFRERNLPGTIPQTIPVATGERHLIPAGRQNGRYLSVINFKLF